MRKLFAQEQKPHRPPLGSASDQPPLRKETEEGLSFGEHTLLKQYFGADFKQRAGHRHKLLPSVIFIPHQLSSIFGPLAQSLVHWAGLQIYRRLDLALP